jgi:hypothetical protein
MSDSKPSIWTKPLVSEASDKKIRRGLDWFAFIVAVAASIAFPILFILNPCVADEEEALADPGVRDNAREVTVFRMAQLRSPLSVLQKGPLHARPRVSHL